MRVIFLQRSLVLSRPTLGLHLRNVELPDLFLFNNASPMRGSLLANKVQLVVIVDNVLLTTSASFLCGLRPVVCVE